MRIDSYPTYICRFKKKRIEFSLRTLLEPTSKNVFSQGHDLVPHIKEITLCNCMAPVCITLDNYMDNVYPDIALDNNIDIIDLTLEVLNIRYCLHHRTEYLRSLFKKIYSHEPSTVFRRSVYTQEPHYKGIL